MVDDLLDGSLEIPDDSRLEVPEEPLSERLKPDHKGGLHARLLTHLVDMIERGEAHIEKRSDDWERVEMNQTGSGVLKVHDKDDERALMTHASDALGFSCDCNSVNDDPDFTNAGTHNYWLANGSPCIDAGVNLGADYEDALQQGSVWPDSVSTAKQGLFGTGWEIGAYNHPMAGVVGESSRHSRWLHLLTRRQRGLRT